MIRFQGEHHFYNLYLDISVYTLPNNNVTAQLNLKTSWEWLHNGVDHPDKQCQLITPAERQCQLITSADKQCQLITAAYNRNNNKVNA